MTAGRGAWVWAALFLAAALVAALAGGAALRLAVATTGDRLDRSLMLSARTLEAEIDRFRALPALMLEDPRIRAAVGDPARRAAANRALEVAAARTGADKLYLLDAGGTAIASSNWAEPGSFLGENYAFRPYFGEAMADGGGRFYAVGVTTGEPGYFLARRARIGAAAAVMVVKIDLRPLQSTWADAEDRLALVDGFGVVILSGDPDLLYRPAAPLDADQRGAIAAARAFADIPAAERPPVLDAAGQARLPGPDGPRLIRWRDIPAEGWRLLGSAPLSGPIRAAWAAAAAAFVATLGLGALAQTHLQRRRMLAMRLRQGALLERRVAERTAALAREIEDRRRAEAELRETQDALVHSEKMAALGRMSAAIVHEISQPLAAMEATLAAALLSNRIGDDYAASRVEKARGHIRRILRTIRHLKSFSRRETGARAPVEVDTAISAAIDLVAPRLSDLGLSIDFAPDGPSPVALAGQVRLEQVLVNLLMNALDAVAGRAGARVGVGRAELGGRVTIAVRDNGPGIPPGLLARVMEPFFSARAGGEGLGLGLSISKAITEEFGGTLDLSSGREGTVATLTFDARAVQGRAA